MARNDWAALVTEAAREYQTRTELERLGLTPYLPQCRRQIRVAHSQFVMRYYPLFPRYILIPYGQTASPSLRLVRGIHRTETIPSGILHTDGRPWRTSAAAIQEIREAEVFGRFDDVPQPGSVVQLSNPALAHLQVRLTKIISPSTCVLLTPLFGGSRAVAKSGEVLHKSAPPTEGTP
jgi:hypothetical protein